MTELNSGRVAPAHVSGFVQSKVESADIQLIDVASQAPDPLQVTEHVPLSGQVMTASLQASVLLQSMLHAASVGQLMMEAWQDRSPVQSMSHCAFNGQVMIVPKHSSDASQSAANGVLSLGGGGYGTFEQDESQVSVLSLPAFQSIDKSMQPFWFLTPEVQRTVHLALSLVGHSIVALLHDSGSLAQDCQ